MWLEVSGSIIWWGCVRIRSLDNELVHTCQSPLPVESVREPYRLSDCVLISFMLLFWWVQQVCFLYKVALFTPNIDLQEKSHLEPCLLSYVFRETLPLDLKNHVWSGRRNWYRRDVAFISRAILHLNIKFNAVSLGFEMWPHSVMNCWHFEL